MTLTLPIQIGKKYVRSCIYKISFTGSLNLYIGSTLNFSRRKRQHIHLLRSGSHTSVHLQRAYDKYGESSLIFDIIEECGNEILQEREQFHIDNNISCLMNYSKDACNPMRDPEVVDRWKANISSGERSRRSELLKTLRDSESMKQAIRDGSNKFLDNGGREILAEKCRTNEARRKAVSQEMIERWKTKEFRERKAELATEQMGKQIVGKNVQTGEETTFRSISEASRS